VNAAKALKGAIGIVETRGFASLVEAMDAMLKASNVTIIGQERIGAGIVAVCIQGEIGSVRVATDAGVEAASKTGGSEVRTTLIANPHRGLASLFI
jgi:ethanolamine utilization protein EutM